MKLYCERNLLDSRRIVVGFYHDRKILAQLSNPADHWPNPRIAAELDIGLRWPLVRFWFTYISAKRIRRFYERQRFSVLAEEGDRALAIGESITKKLRSMLPPKAGA